jgi:probable H4MPT-linked C1 transfer pathway protein
MHKHNTTLGWDIGGAHLKAALVDADGTALQVIQVPCALWRGLDQLEKAIDAVSAKLDHMPDQHAVTMTGELADVFTDRNEGVVRISALMIEHFGSETRFYAGLSGLVSAREVSHHAAEIASANWLASATYMAMQVNQGLLIDIGSTTADFILLSDGKPQIRGYSDAERMQFEELVYSGVVRTPLMALADRVPFAGEWHTLAAEHFATTADVYRLTGDLNEAEDMAETADGAGKTPEESARRLARMIGRDLHDAPISAWIGLAYAFKQIQLNTLKNAAMRNFSRHLIDYRAPIIVAGAGGFMVRDMARQLKRRYLEVGYMISAHNDETRSRAGVCFPAYAVACLAAKSAT